MASPSISLDDTVSTVDDESAVNLAMASPSISLDDNASTVDDESAVNPEAALIAWRAVFNAPTAMSTTLDEVAKNAVQSLRDGVGDGWTDAHGDLLEEIVNNLMDCNAADWEEEGGQTVKNACIECSKHPKRNDIIKKCGLFDVCAKAVLSNVSDDSRNVSINCLFRLAERRITASDPGFKTYTGIGEGGDRELVCVRLDVPSTVISAGRLDMQAADFAAAQVSALLAAGRAFMDDADWRVRSATMRWLVDLASDDSVWSAEAAAAAFSPLIMGALADEVKDVRATAVICTQRLLDDFPTALTPDCFGMAISGALRHVLGHAQLHEILDTLAAAAPEGVLRGEFDAAVGRLAALEDVIDEEVRREQESAAFFGVFIAARLTGESCTDTFVKEFNRYINRYGPHETDETEEPNECYALYDAPADVVVRKLCDWIGCGECACSKAHFCTPCIARIFIAAEDPHNVTCPLCRRAICVDDLRVLKGSGRPSDRSPR